MLAQAVKVCKVCGVKKPIEEYQVARGRPANPCNTCRWERHKRYRAADPEKTKAKNRRSKLKTTYGITPEQYDEILKSQDMLCAICKEPPCGRWPRLSVDHCHDTGKIRGLLCTKCNYGLGLFNDSAECLQEAVAYLQRR